MAQCSQHDLLKEFLQHGLSDVKDQLAAIAEALKDQNVAAAKKMDHILESQGERRELCGKRGAEIVALQQSDTTQWEELRRQREENAELNKVVWKREGALVVVAVICSAVISALLRYFVR